MNSLKAELYRLADAVRAGASEPYRNFTAAVATFSGSLLLRARPGKDRPQAGHDSGCTPDGDSGPQSTRNLGDPVNDLKQVSKLTGRRIRTDVYRITDARRFPGAGIEPARRAHADSFHPDTYCVAAASRYTSLSTQPAAARWRRWPPVKSASTVTPSGVHRCGKLTARPEPDLIVPAATATSNRLSISHSLSPPETSGPASTPKILTCREVCLRRRQVGRRDARVRLAGMPGCRRRASAWGRCIHPAVPDHLAICREPVRRDRSAPASAASPVTSPAPDRARVSRHSRPGRRPTLTRRARTFACILMPGARQGLRSQVTGPRSRVGREWPGHLPCLPVITTSGWVTAKGTCDDS
jgi:hypothetical protein